MDQKKIDRVSYNLVYIYTIQVVKEKKKGKDAGPKVFKTVSSAFRSQLDSLLTTLNSTDPHFIRCIVPNNHKTPLLLDSALVMHQVPPSPNPLHL